jgi:hypothetical protein
MPDDTSDALLSYADILAAELPGAWSVTYHPPTDTDVLATLDVRLWDLDLVAQHLAEHPLQHAATLTRADGAEFAVLPRNGGGFLTAALAPRALPDEAFRHVPEPHGIALANDPFTAAEQVSTDLLARYEIAAARVRANALSTIPASEPGWVVIAFQPSGGLAATPVDATARTVMISAGFGHDAPSGICYKGPADLYDQAVTLHDLGRELSARGIDLGVESRPRRRPAPTATAPASQLRTPPARHV